MIDIGGTPFVPTLSELHRAQVWSNARSGTGATRSASASMREHGEDPPFDQAEHGATFLHCPRHRDKVAVILPTGPNVFLNRFYSVFRRKSACKIR